MIVMPSKRRRFAAHRSFLDQVIETLNPGPHKPASPKIGPSNVGLIERLGNTFASAFLGTCNLVQGPLSRALWYSAVVTWAATLSKEILLINELSV